MSQLAIKRPQDTAGTDERAAIRNGFRLSPKRLSSKYFYDETGSRLFDEICELPEYYPTRTELGIMRAHIDEMAALVGPRASLIELGSGSSLKTRVLLDHLHDLAAYVPVDISAEHLLHSARAINDDYPHIEVLPVAADFTIPFRLPSPAIMPTRNIVYFPGSTIGNFPTPAALGLLRVMRQQAGHRGAALIGVDLQKDPAILERAYNDAQGVTARFNLNILQHMNDAFDATFDLSRFRHRAIYNEAEGRIEMYLDSIVDHSVMLAGEWFVLRRGEAILTEHSHKYTLDGFAELASQCGFRVARVWTDAERLFSVQYCLAV